MLQSRIRGQCARQGIACVTCQCVWWANSTQFFDRKSSCGPVHHHNAVLDMLTLVCIYYEAGRKRCSFVNSSWGCHWIPVKWGLCHPWTNCSFFLLVTKSLPVVHLVNAQIDPSEQHLSIGRTWRRILSLWRSTMIKLNLTLSLSSLSRQVWHRFSILNPISCSKT